MREKGVEWSGQKARKRDEGGGAGAGEAEAGGAACGGWELWSEASSKAVTHPASRAHVTWHGYGYGCGWVRVCVQECKGGSMGKSVCKSAR